MGKMFLCVVTHVRAKNKNKARDMDTDSLGLLVNYDEKGIVGCKEGKN
jgi:hypothetical protein